jgi:crotonobetainyl-CoA:carnitine CoA-transferase CaiB-like acyl-CoA transferase
VQKKSEDWLVLLEENGIPCAPINDVKAALEDETTKALQMVVDIEHKGVDLSFRAPGNPIRMSGAAEPRLDSPPLLGEHTRSILSELLHYTEDRIETLKRESCIR